MDSDDLLDLVAASPRQTLDTGSSLLVEGTRSRALYVLVEGELEVRRRGIPVVTMADPGAIVGELGLLLDQPASADVVAAVPTTVHRIEDGDALLRESPELLWFLARVLARRLHQASTYLTDLREQFADRSETLRLVPDVLRELMDTSTHEHDPGSERERDSPY